MCFSFIDCWLRDSVNVEDPKLGVADLAVVSRWPLESAQVYLHPVFLCRSEVSMFFLINCFMHFPSVSFFLFWGLLSLGFANCQELGTGVCLRWCAVIRISLIRKSICFLCCFITQSCLYFWCMRNAFCWKGKPALWKVAPLPLSENSWIWEPFMSMTRFLYRVMDLGAFSVHEITRRACTPKKVYLGDSQSCSWKIQRLKIVCWNRFFLVQLSMCCESWERIPINFIFLMSKVAHQLSYVVRWTRTHRH